MVDSNDFIFTTDIKQACADKYSGYCLHVLCLDGTVSFGIDNKTLTMSANDIMIKSTTKRITSIECSDDLRVEALLISTDYLNHNCPQTDYQVKGYLATADNPVFTVQHSDIEQIQRDFQNIHRRLSQPYNNFIDDIMRHEVETLILDLYDAHSRSDNGSTKGKARASEILQRFIMLLQGGSYRENRRVDYYASQLFVSPKYLSEACVSASGYNASYWIERYTTDAISHELRDTDKTLQQIADEYNFSTVSSFSRYVKEHLHATPVEYRIQ